MAIKRIPRPFRGSSAAIRRGPAAPIDPDLLAGYHLQRFRRASTKKLVCGGILSGPGSTGNPRIRKLKSTRGRLRDETWGFPAPHEVRPREEGRSGAGGVSAGPRHEGRATRACTATPASVSV